MGILVKFSTYSKGSPRNNPLKLEKVQFSIQFSIFAGSISYFPSFLAVFCCFLSEMWLSRSLLGCISRKIYKFSSFALEFAKTFSKCPVNFSTTPFHSRKQRKTARKWGKTLISLLKRTMNWEKYYFTLSNLKYVKFRIFFKFGFCRWISQNLELTYLLSRYYQATKLLFQ